MAIMSNHLNEPQVVCPHCWRKFYPDEAVYISSHPDLYGDSKLGDHEKTRYVPSAIQVDREGNAFDPKGSRMTERACPNCHLQIPPELRTKRGRIISLAGAPSAGKTYFLTSMMHQLRTELATNFCFALRDSDSHDVRAFLEYENKLFDSSRQSQHTLLEKTAEAGQLYNRVTINGAQISLPKPFIFSLSPGLNHPSYHKKPRDFNTSVVFYDNAGESFDYLKEQDATSRVTQHLTESDAVLFAFDPTLHADTMMRLQSISSDPQVNEAKHTVRQDSVLSEVANRIRRHRRIEQNKPINVPLLICVQKYDIWKSLVPHPTRLSEDGRTVENIDHSSVEFFREHGIAGLDLAEINRVSLLIREFLNDIDSPFVALAESQFKTVRYFPVSALGTSPEFDPKAKPTANPRQFLRVLPSRIKPFRVTHPFLWLLLQWRLISSLKKTNKPPPSIPFATAEPQGDRIRVTLPRSNRKITLDSEYSSSWIIDPFSGERVWIPEVPIEPEQEEKRRPQSQNPPSIEELRLPKPAPPKPKRGWFRK
jgi:hypothetical protein